MSETEIFSITSGEGTLTIGWFWNKSWLICGGETPCDDDGELWLVTWFPAPGNRFMVGDKFGLNGCMLLFLGLLRSWETMLLARTLICLPSANVSITVGFSFLVLEIPSPFSLPLPLAPLPLPLLALLGKPWVARGLGTDGLLPWYLLWYSWHCL